MKNLPTELLRTFVTIKGLGSFTSAGELLGRSQPAISLQIKKLEELLDTRIFLRGTTLELTADGEYLYYAAKRILEINDATVAKLRGDSIAGKVRLGIPNDFEMAFLPKILRSLAKIYPNVMVEVDCEISRVIQQRYQRHAYDIALIMEPEKATEDRDPQDYRQDKLEWVCGTDETVRQANPLLLVGYPQGCVYRQMTELALNQAKQEFRMVYTSTSLLGIFTAVEEGLGITSMARSVIPKHLRRIADPATLPELGDVCIGYYYREAELSRATRHVLDFLRAGLTNIPRCNLPHYNATSQYCVPARTGSR